MAHTLHYRVVGEQTIHCQGCEHRIGNALRRLRGVQDVRASSHTQRVQVTIDPATVGPDQLEARLEQIGYRVEPLGAGA